MKKAILVILVFILMIEVVLSVCCSTEGTKIGGCYPGRPKCCPEETRMVGYEGCIAAIDPDNPSKYSYYCPGEYLGECLKCSNECEPDGHNCDWEETDMCVGIGICVVDYLSGTDIPSMLSYCSYRCGEGEVWDVVEECVLQDGDKICYDADCIPNKACCKNGEFGKDGEQGAVCSGDLDEDGVCNYYDNCGEVANGPNLGTCVPLFGLVENCVDNAECGDKTCSMNQEDSDNDMIGDACEFEGMCYSPYGDRQCCDELPYATSGSGEFYGFTPDCPEGGIGCWSECLGEDPDTGEIIKYEMGPCVDGKRKIKILTYRDGGSVDETTKEEACSGIPLIPFFTNFNMLMSLLILVSFYYFREK